MRLGLPVSGWQCHVGQFHVGKPQADQYQAALYQTGLYTVPLAFREGTACILLVPAPIRLVSRRDLHP